MNADDLGSTLLAEMPPKLTGDSPMAGLGAALRRLREKAGLSQAQIQERAKLGASTVSDWEREVSAPHLDSLAAVLKALNLTLSDLAAALDEVNGRAPVASAGKPRMRWVSGLTLRPRFDLDSLTGFLYGLGLEDEQGRADFIASVEYTARKLGEAALRRVDEETAKANVLRFPERDPNEDE